MTPANGGKQWDGDARPASPDLAAVYAEIKRLDQLRGADQVALSAALLAAKTAVDAALAAAEKAVSAALIASKEAVTKAEIAQGKTNESQNEFRGQLRDQANTFLTRAEWDLSHRSLVEKLGVATEAVGDLRSRIDLGPPSLVGLQSALDQDQGRKQGSAQRWSYAIAGIGATIGVLGLLMALAKMFVPV